MSKYQAYPEYKNSNIEWLDKIPANWKCVKTSYFFKIGMGQTILKEQLIDNGLCPVYSATEKDIFLGRINNPNVKLIAGDIVIPARGNSIGAVKLVSQNSTTTQTTIYCKPLQPHLLVSKFVYYFFNGERKNLFWFTQTAIPQITTEEVGSNPLLLPSISEQTQIAAFLDHETAKIDTLIEKQQQLIELLKEKRQAVISHAVTKGLNPDAPMKDSGVEWLGEVPEHWEGSLFKYLVNQMGGGTPDKSNTSFWNGDIPWVSPKDMKVDYISSSQDFITETAIKESSTKLIPEHSILMVVRGMILIHSVPVALTIKPVTINQDMKALIPSAKILPEFLLFFLKGLKDYILDFVETSAHGTKCLRTEDFENMLLFIPPKDEQAAILSSIKTAITQLDSLIKKANNAISLMQERRTALISAAVTGKIDVRNWVAPTTSSDANEAQQEVTA